MDPKLVAKRTRWYRKIHRYIAIVAFFFMLLVSVTGLLLVWKKNTGGYLLADSHKGSSTDIGQWLSFDSLHKVAVAALRDSVSPHLSSKINRIDARPDKGMVKFVFEDHYWAVQLDCASGKVLHVERRRADFIENLHDGSYFDKLIGGKFKLSYGSFVGLSLLFLSITGFYLWYNPRRMRKKKREGINDP